MRTRTTILAAGTALLSAALVVGLPVITNGSASAGDLIARVRVMSMPPGGMGDGMPGTMDGRGMAGMMGTADMNAMHASMHESMRGVVADDVLEACDDLHDSMSTAVSSVDQRGMDVAQHARHHGTSQP